MDTAGIEEPDICPHSPDTDDTSLQCLNFTFERFTDKFLPILHGIAGAAGVGND